ncbi:AAA family ATPase, partial [Gordonia polyisoprenivorans]
MRVSRLAIRSWRNLRDVDLNMDKAAPLVCLVGENGAGKSTVLEVLSAAAHSLGISQGVQNTRGDIFTEPHDIDITVYVPPEEIQFSESSYFTDELRDAASRWTGELHLHSVRGSATQSTVSAGVSTQADLNSSAQADTRLSERLGDAVVAALRERRETQHLYLDADRAYPPAEVPLHEYGQIFSQEWRNPDVTRNSAFQPSRTLYTEWIKYFVGVDENELSKYSMALRRARDSGNPDPKFDDPFEGYAASLRQVLPHLRFAGVAKGGGQPRTPIFDSAGIELAFSHLSGGEREVAFILGQIDRFRLRRGLLLIDEPELHLNPDLLRRWLAYLRDTIVSGQVWIATHSLEAVEVAGPSATFVFERNPETRLVTAPKLLSGRPVLSALSAAVGSPAFALGKLRFIYIEGDRQTRERERFYAVCGDETTNRFLEGGGCRDVLRRLSDIKTLSAESQEQLHIGGVIDRDFRTDSQADELERDYSVHVLGCHEVENLFLHPEAIDALLTSMFRGVTPPRESVRWGGLRTGFRTEAVNMWPSVGG